jgi:hypothetical protein
MVTDSFVAATQFWTATNIANGLNALAICIEVHSSLPSEGSAMLTFPKQMVFFSAFMWWAYSSNEYKIEGAKKTSIWRPLWDSINFCKFLIIGPKCPKTRP